MLLVCTSNAYLVARQRACIVLWFSFVCLFCFMFLIHRTFVSLVCNKLKDSRRWVCANCKGLHVHVSSEHHQGEIEGSSFHKIGRVSHLNYLTQYQHTDRIALGGDGCLR